MFSPLCSVYTHTHFALFMSIEKRKMTDLVGVAEGALTFSGLASTFLPTSFMYPSRFRGITVSVPSCIFVVSENPCKCSECDFYINAQ